MNPGGAGLGHSVAHGVGGWKPSVALSEQTGPCGGTVRSGTLAVRAEGRAQLACEPERPHVALQGGQSYVALRALRADAPCDRG